jgi:mono/diheme cytochrome c family protein
MRAPYQSRPDRRRAQARGPLRFLSEEARVARAPWLVGIALVAACSPAGEGADPLVARGRAVYLANCVACHATDPAREGGVGPAIAGSSRELLEARLLRGEYPPGYVPKRTSGAMPKFVHLERDIDALHAFLAQPSAPDAAPGRESAGSG